VVTTQTTHLRDWKITTGYRVLVQVGWGVIALAVFFGAAASWFDTVAIWWLVAGLAVVVILTSLLLPEPVPRDMITGGPHRIDSRHQ
jgi:predicted cobalt transporter CbtA